MRRLAALHAGGGRLQPLGRGRARDPRRLRQQRSGCYRARLLEAGVAAIDQQIGKPPAIHQGRRFAPFIMIEDNRVVRHVPLFQMG